MTKMSRWACGLLLCAALSGPALAAETEQSASGALEALWAAIQELFTTDTDPNMASEGDPAAEPDSEFGPLMPPGG